jgi:uncharacterized protein (TIGR02757 family)
MSLDRRRLDSLYEEWNRPEYVSPDPLETLADYPATPDREVAALVAASMAYGRVASILPPLKKVLKAMGPSPRLYILENREKDIASDLDGIVHRFARATHLAALLAGAAGAVHRNGSLESAFLKGYRKGGTVSGLNSLSDELRKDVKGKAGHLLPEPERGSACKRLNLYLRWMVRRDSVDPGGWDGVDTADLFLPLDTWTYRIAVRAGWTGRVTPDMKTVIEVSRALSKINPEDPVRYDFALSRFGIRAGLSLDELFENAGSGTGT